VVRVAAIGVAAIGAKCRDLHVNWSLGDNDDAEFRADGEAVWKQFLDAFGSGVGRNVVIDGLASEQDVAHTPAREVGLVTVVAQDATYLLGELARTHRRIMREKWRRGKLEVPGARIALW